ncbi:MAG: threonine synthase [Candidatus Pacebacteria bacterium]|nr:threonine synthase [Candidatus Paceibacterota bacterium]
MLYISTRGQTDPVRFRDAVMMGLATDGGLLLPRVIPDVTDHLGQWRSLSYPDLAVEVMSTFIGNDIPHATLRELVYRSYRSFKRTTVVDLVDVNGLTIMELFHGPTLAFKDIALQFLGNLFEYILADRDTHLNILGATSGDTGSAAIYGTRGKANINIFIMHPSGRVSPIQERQMTTVMDGNVHNIAIEGDFDDAQRILKELFGDLEFKSAYRLGAVNSVNWARVLAQIVYYFYAALRLQAHMGCERVQFAVPTGNFGDIFAGYMALRMGAPIERLILATNQNDILTRFFTAGVYARGEVHPTLSPSMDIQVASNFERYLYYRVGEDARSIRDLMQQFQQTGRIELEGRDPLFAAGSGAREDTLDTIATFHRNHSYLLDPHTAVGVCVAQHFLMDEYPTVCLATAHPAKFPDAIREATGQDIARHQDIDALMNLPTRCTILPATEEAVKSFILETV